MAYEMTNDEVLESVARITPQWLAGFFDGEGCVRCFKNPKVYTIDASISQSDAKILSIILIRFGGGLTERKYRGRRYYNLRWIGKSALPLFEYIKDHAICKRRQVLAGLELARLIKESGSCVLMAEEKKREELAILIRESNHGINTKVEVLP